MNVKADISNQGFPEQNLTFCNMIDYRYLYINGDMTYGNDSFAFEMFQKFEKALSLYNCYDEKKVSTVRSWNCAACQSAYKAWLCAALFRRCHIEETVDDALAKNTRRIGRNCSNVTAAQFCPLGSDITPSSKAGCVFRTCFDVCYKVVRECPVHLQFKCPPLKDDREYTNQECNSIGRRSAAALPAPPAPAAPVDEYQAVLAPSTATRRTTGAMALVAGVVLVNVIYGRCA